MLPNHATSDIKLGLLSIPRKKCMLISAPPLLDFMNDMLTLFSRGLGTKTPPKSALHIHDVQNHPTMFDFVAQILCGPSLGVLHLLDPCLPSPSPKG